VVSPCGSENSSLLEHLAIAFFTNIKQRRSTMGSFLGTLALGYLATCGTVTVGCVVGRGLLRAAEHASGGEIGKAGESILASAVAPALMAYDAVALFTGEVVDSARGLTTTVLVRADAQTQR